MYSSSGIHRQSASSARSIWISVEPDAFARVVDFDPVEDRLVFDQPLENFNLLTTNRGTRVMNDGRAVAFVAGTAVDLELHAIEQSFDVV